MNSNIENAGLKKLKEAFREINEWEYENLHLDTLEEVIPSTRYRKRMERLIRRQKQPYWKYVNTVGKRVAVFAVAIALVFALSMSVSAVREPVVEFFANVYEKFVEFFYDEDDIAKAPETIETVYTLGYVPEGYKLEMMTFDEYIIRMIWINNDGERLYFSQTVLNVHNSLDNEDTNYNVFQINDMMVVCIEKHNVVYYYWNSCDYRYLLKTSTMISEDAIIDVIQSLKKYNE